MMTMTPCDSTDDEGRTDSDEWDMALLLYEDNWFGILQIIH